MDNLSAAQFESIRRGSQAAVDQTRPMLGTVKKVADALGYKLGRTTTSTVTRDDNGNVQSTQVHMAQGFGSLTQHRDADGNLTRTSKQRSGIPGLFGGVRSTTENTVRSRNQTTRTGQAPGQPPGGGPVPPTTPGAPTSPTTPNSPTNPTNPLRPPMPFTPNPHGLRPNGVMNSRLWPGEPPQAPSPFQHTPQPLNLGAVNPTAPQNLGPPPQPGPLPFNGAPQGRSDYGGQNPSPAPSAPPSSQSPVGDRLNAVLQQVHSNTSPQSEGRLGRLRQQTPINFNATPDQRQQLLGLWREKLANGAPSKPSVPQDQTVRRSRMQGWKLGESGWER